MQALSELCDRLAAGDSAGLLLLGQPGIGKSALLLSVAAHARANGFAVLETSGVPAESAIPYAALHRLLQPVRTAVGQLPPPARAALERACAGERAGADPGPVGRAVVELLSRAAADRPVLVIVDDLHWLDPATYDTLVFVASRAAVGPVGLVAAAREASPAPALTCELPALHLRGLGEADARELLGAQAEDLRPWEREDVLAQANGNPLALIELSLAQECGRGAQPEIGDLPRLTPQLLHAFAPHLPQLPADTRDALLIAALHCGDELPRVLAGASQLAGKPLTRDVLRPALAQGLLCVTDSRVAFPHLVTRAAVVQGQGTARRLAAHTALAHVLRDDERQRVWHLSQAVVGPDDELADQLEARHTAEASGLPAMTVIRALQRAAQLTTASGRRGRRLLLAAEHAVGMGRTDFVERLTVAAARTDLEDADRTRLQRLREVYADGVPGDAAQVLHLCRLAERSARANDTELALNLALSAALRCWRSDPGARLRARVTSALSAAAGTENDPRHIAVLAAAEPVQQARTVAAHLARPRPGQSADPDRLRLLGQAAHHIGDCVTAVDLLRSSAVLLRQQNRLGLLPRVLTMQVASAVWLGEWEHAAETARQAHLLAVRTSQQTWAVASQTMEAVLSGMRGDPEQALALADESAEAVWTAGEHRMNHRLAWIRIARGVAFSGAGRHEEAYQELRRLFDPTDPAHHLRECFGGMVFLAQAAVHTGQYEDARAVLAGLERTACLTPVPLLHHSLGYARAVLAPDDEAEAYYQRALAPDLTRWPLIRAMTHLAYGSWLRRRRRAVESRGPLRIALSTFEAMGACGRVAQTAAELRASGERAGTGARSAGGPLTPQELQIARLAAQGLTNRQIAQRLSLAPRTVGSHLYRMFPKLGITSRTQLAAHPDLTLP